LLPRRERLLTSACGQLKELQRHCTTASDDTKLPGTSSALNMSCLVPTLLFTQREGRVVQDTIADVESLSAVQSTRKRIYKGNALRVLGIAGP
jgi:hypothetical protein